MATQTLIYPVSTVQPNCRVCRPCMIIMREPTTFYLVTPCNVACVSEKRVRKKIRRMRDVRPEAILRLSSLCRDLASLGIIQLGNDQRYCNYDRCTCTIYNTSIEGCSRDGRVKKYANKIVGISTSTIHPYACLSCTYCHRPFSRSKGHMSDQLIF